MKVREFIEKLQHYNQDYEVMFIVPPIIDYKATNCLDIELDKEQKQINIIQKIFY